MAEVIIMNLDMVYSFYFILLLNSMLLQQGIQFIVDDSGGFSSVAADFLENIADEYTNTPVLLYAARGPGTYMNTISRKQAISRALHDVVSFSRLSSFCKLIVPIGLPSLSRSQVSAFLRIDDEKPYHCSAVYAAAIHSTSQARQNMVGILDVAMPALSLTGIFLIGEQNEQSFEWNLHSLTPEIAEDVKDLQAVESLTIHGALGSGGSHTSISEVKDSVYAGYQCAMKRPMFSHLSVASCPLPMPLPFHKIFGNLVGQHGELLRSPIPGSQSRGSFDVHSIPMAARLRSSSAILPFIQNRLGNLRRFGTERGAFGIELVRSWGFGKHELEDMGEGLSKMVMALDPKSHISSDSD
ncbi:hypothetical protein HHK36_008439 [Tetracentron sinense]|uniref:Uncharacterized protein n=1 Tax=Tetracentron sinense TaxID=13715 RepID=A0A835DN65_TETSI|nr:hypothetical protein HHK36_008439 [Tetracentron sinense]